MIAARRLRRPLTLLGLPERAEVQAEEAEAVANHQTPHLEKIFKLRTEKKVTKPPLLADHTFHAFMAIDIVNSTSYYMSTRFFSSKQIRELPQDHTFVSI